mmetsp:Transcript_32057/g.78673  ORF Transcript_32057/g.78673 Transcript_32057/m.78673 type:complete len:84 (+) Transcript_32057:533-784(+)
MSVPHRCLAEQSPEQSARTSPARMSARLASVCGDAERPERVHTSRSLHVPLWNRLLMRSRANLLFCSTDPALESGIVWTTPGA